MGTEKVSYTSFRDALLKGDRVYCSQFIQNELNKNKSIFELYESIIRESMYEIGELWEFNKISTATEHLASAIVEAILNEIYPVVVSDKNHNNSVVLACVENEMHQIGIKMVSDVFELNGWKTYFLGVNVPTYELIRFVKEIKPELLAISMSLYFHLPVMEKMTLQINKELPDLKIFIGGQGFQLGGKDIFSGNKNIEYFPDLISLNNYLKNFQQDV